MISSTYKDKLDSYLNKISNIEANSIHEVLAEISDDFIFIDPFNHTQGKANYQKVLEAALHDSLDMKFSIKETIRNENIAYLSWNYSFRPRNKILGDDKISLDGMSEIKISDSGLISYHRDYWDVSSTIYERIPVIGFILKKLRRRIAIRD
jgi:steroid delta-isomerase